MKKILIAAAAMSALIFSACNNSSSDKKTDAGRDTTGSNTQVEIPDTNGAASIQSVLEGYLQIKNALAEDDGAEAANGGKAIEQAMGKIDKSFFTSDQKKVYDNIEEELKEQIPTLFTDKQDSKGNIVNENISQQETLRKEYNLKDE